MYVRMYVCKYIYTCCNPDTTRPDGAFRGTRRHGGAVCKVCVEPAFWGVSDLRNLRFGLFGYYRENRGSLNGFL